MICCCFHCIRALSNPSNTAIPSIPKPRIPLLSTNGKVAISHVTGHVTNSNMKDIAVPSFPSAPPTSGFPVLQGTYKDKVGACRVPGPRPVRKMGIRKLTTRLRQYPIPDELRDCVEEGVVGDVMTMEPSLEEVCTCIFISTHT